MNNKAVETYYKTLKKVCGSEKEDVSVKIHDAIIFSNGVSRLLVENDYGDKVYEYVDGVNYSSVKDKGTHFVNFDDCENNTKEIIQKYGLALKEDHYDLVVDALVNCEDWHYDEHEKLEDVVARYLEGETDLTMPEAHYLVESYFKIPVKERMAMDEFSMVRQMAEGNRE